MNRADELLGQISCGLMDGDGRDVNELLSELHRGYPVEKLRPLLQTGNVSAVRAAAWLASELGSLAAPLLHDVPGLLTHSESYVRFYALDVVLVNAGHDDGELLARAAILVVDSVESVRWKALQFLARASEEQLAVSIPCQRHQGIAAFTAWLLDSHRSDEVIERLEAPDQLTRRFAAVAAARMCDRDPAALERAAETSDHEVADFAKYVVEICSLMRSR